LKLQLFSLAETANIWDKVVLSTCYPTLRLLAQEIVQDASVSVSISVNSPFALPQDYTQDNSSAVAVTLILAENTLLSATEVQLIAATIRNAVPHLDLVSDKISIMDSNENIYSVSD